ncbi:MAG: bacteriohemerythrin [Sideroxydans sp.]|nr:bacteriohemerythrin [Sideroxydans sp.]
MVLIEWSDQFELGVACMDSAHHEFVNLLERLNSAPEKDLPALFAKLVEHTAQHFAQEERWMAESGFPPIELHRDEHRRVLDILHEALQQVQAGDMASGKTLAREMLAWFEQHAASMDLALARHIEATGYSAD